MSDWRDRETPRLANLKRDLAECIARVKNLEAERDAIEAATVERLAIAMMAFPNSSPHENARMAAFIRSQVDTAGEQKGCD
jgi:hypothetical protein